MRRWRRIAAMALVLAVPAGYLAVCAGLYFWQDHLVYAPMRPTVERMEAEAAGWKCEPWVNAKGERIGWKSLEGDPNKALLVFQGNGGYALTRNFYRHMAEKKGDWSIFMLEYPGYGARQGVPSEKSLIAAGMEAFDELARLPGREIRVLGESLGTGVASAVAAERGERVAGVILLTPYDRIVNVGAGRLPGLPVKWLMRTRFDSVKNLESYPGPVAFVVAESDRVVPAPLGKNLYEGYQGRKRLWVDTETGHDTTEYLRRGGWGEIVEWLQGGGG